MFLTAGSDHIGATRACVLLWHGGRVAGHTDELSDNERVAVDDRIGVVERVGVGLAALVRVDQVVAGVLYCVLRINVNIQQNSQECKTSFQEKKYLW